MMRIGTALTKSLQSFAALEKEIVALGQRVDASSAVEFVRLRKQLVLAFADVGAALEKDEWLKGQPGKLEQGLRVFSAFRAQNSINQANWPAVRVKDAVSDYQIAARPVAEKSRDFWKWVEEELGYRK
jgi:hypothetical protein